MRTFKPEHHILVTGASSGIGRAIALRLNAEGATVFAHGRNAERLAALTSTITAKKRFITVQRDLIEDMDGLPAWLNELRQHYGPFYGLVCAAGITWNCPMSFYPLHKAHEIFDVCCHAPLILGGAFCDKRNNTGTGCSIVYIAAAAAIHPNPGQGIYGAAKAALVAGAKCQALEMGHLGLRINSISPGLVETPMLEATVRQLGMAFLERERLRYPLGFGTVNDVANLTVFLLSEQSRWLTGQNILLSGGC